MLSVRFVQNFRFRLANGGRQRQRDNQQGKDNAEGDVEAAKQGGDQRTADAADTKS